MSTRLRHQLVAVLALAALGWAHLFGLTRGYLCDCGGELAVTAAEHCHGPHSTECHDAETVDCHHDEAHPHDHDGKPADDDTHHHPPVKETVVAQHHPGKAATPAVPPLAAISTLEGLMARACRETPSSLGAGQLRDDGGGGRRWPRVLARTIALRV